MFIELFFPFLAGFGQGIEEWARFHDLRHHVFEQLLLLFVRDFDFVQDFIAENDKGCAQGLHELLAIFIGVPAPWLFGIAGPQSATTARTISRTRNRFLLFMGCLPFRSSWDGENQCG